MNDKPATPHSQEYVTLRDYFDRQLADLLRLVTITAEENRRFLEERSLRIEERFNAQEKAVQVALIGQEKAVAAAMAAAEKAAIILESQAKEWRLQANEWRAAMTDRDKNYLTREAAQQGFLNLEKQVSELKDRTTRSEAKALGSSSAINWLLAVVPVVIGVITIIVVFSRK